MSHLNMIAYVNFPEKPKIPRSKLCRYIDEEFQFTSNKIVVFNNVCKRAEYKTISSQTFNAWYLQYETNRGVFDRKVGRFYGDLLSDVLNAFQKILTNLVQPELEKPTSREVVFLEVCRKLDYPELTLDTIAKYFRVSQI
jgi:hypothetical protein